MADTFAANTSALSKTSDKLSKASSNFNSNSSLSKKENFKEKQIESKTNNSSSKSSSSSLGKKENFKEKQIEAKTNNSSSKSSGSSSSNTGSKSSNNSSNKSTDSSSNTGSKSTNNSSNNSSSLSKKENFKEKQIETKTNNSSSKSTNKTNINTSSSSVNKATEKINTINKNVSKKYDSVTKSLNNYIEKVNDIEVKLSNNTKSKLNDNNISISKMSNSSLTKKDIFKEQQLEDRTNLNTKKVNLPLKENKKINNNTSIEYDLIKDLGSISNKVYGISTNDLIERKKFINDKIASKSNKSSESIKPLSQEELTVAGSISIAVVTSAIWSKVKSLFTGKNEEDTFKETLKETSKVTNTIATSSISFNEGFSSVLEDTLKGLGVINLKTNPLLNNKQKENLGNIFSTEYTKNSYNNFYNDNIFGSYLKQNTNNFDTKRQVFNTVGYIAPGIVAEVYTGGTGIASTLISGISQTGKGTTEALTEGATFNEASTYGTLRGTLTAATVYAGKGINGLNIFGTGTTSQVLANASSHVALDGGLSVVSSLIDSGLKTVYTPRNNLDKLGFSSEEEWKNAPFSEKYNARFNASGGWNKVKTNALTGMAFSSIFEGISATKQIIDINKANNIYLKLKNNNNSLKNAMETTDNIDASIRESTIDSLVTERNSIEQAYNNLTPSQKYYFELTATRDAINNGTLSGNGINSIINSSNVGNISSSLSRSEQNTLIKQMTDEQLFNYISRLDTNVAKKIVSNNSSYLNNRFFNTSNASNNWASSTNIFNNENGLMVINNNLPLTNSNIKTNSNSMVSLPYKTVSQIKSTINGTMNNSMNISTFRNRAYDAETIYVKNIDDTLQEFYSSVNSTSAIPSERKALSIIEKKYEGNTSLQTTFNSYYDDIASKSKKLSDTLTSISVRESNTNSKVSKLSIEISKTRQGIQTNIKEIEDRITDYEASGIGLFDPRNSIVKAYKEIKKEYQGLDTSLIELESKINVEKKTYETTIKSLGSELVGETNLSKLNEIINPPKNISERQILTDDILRNNSRVRVSNGKTNIGFQFFANKKTNNLYNANDMPLSSDPKIRSVQNKIANGDSLSMFEKTFLRDKTYKNIGNYECKPDYCYRAISKETYELYKEKGYILGQSKEYQELADGTNNNAGVDWYLGGYAKKYGSIIIECPADKDYFVPASDGGNRMSTDITVKHMKSSPKQNPIPFSKITRVFDLSKIKEDTDINVNKITSNDDSLSSVGFQFFANKKRDISTFRNRAYDAETIYVKNIDDTLQEFYSSVNSTSAIPSERKALSIIEKKYEGNTSLQTTFNSYYDDIASKSKKLSDTLTSISVRESNTNSKVSKLSIEISKTRQGIQTNIKEIEDRITDYEASGIGLFDPRNSIVKAYKEIKKEYQNLDTSLIELESKIKLEKKTYESTITSLGSELVGETNLSKLNEIINSPKKISERQILTDDILRNNSRVRVSNGTSNIGFQFFANKKSNALSNLFTKKENATDIFFSDFDNKSNTYGVNQEFIQDNVSYGINPNNITFSRNGFYNYLTSKYPNTPLSELKSNWDSIFSGNAIITNPSEIISYLSSRNYGNINRAIEEFESMTTKYQSNEYLKSREYLMSKGMTRNEAISLLTFMNSTGVCSYTDIVNEILTSYRNNPKLFKSQFGYGLYTYTDGKKTLNGNQLLLDLYTFVNTYYQDINSGNTLFRVSSDGRLHINNLDTSNQVYLEKDDYYIVEKFLKSKDPSLSYKFEYKMVKPSSNPEKVKHQIKEALKSGNVGITVYSKNQNEKLSLKNGVELGSDGTTYFYNQDGTKDISTASWNEGEAHAMFVTGYNSKGVIVSSWGRKYIIKYEDLANNFYRIRFSTIGGIE